MEIMAVVGLLCIAGPDGDACHEEIMAYMRSPMRVCTITMAEIAEWKLHSKFRDEKWELRRIDCHGGDYQVKEST